MSDTKQGDAIPSVLTEIQAGDGLALSAAGRMFPAHHGSGRVTPSTVNRWVTRGARTPTGEIVKLGACRCGGRWLTTPGAVGRFLAALTAAASPDTTLAQPVPRSLAKRQRATEKAINELEKKKA